MEPQPGNKAGGIGLTYIANSFYFWINVLSLTIYPFCRVFLGLENKSKTFMIDNVGLNSFNI